MVVVAAPGPNCRLDEAALFTGCGQPQPTEIL
jgi:hypothetical protein